MKLPISSTILAAALLCGAGHAQAAVSLSLTDLIGAPTEVTLAPGDSFSLRLELTATTENIVGLSYALETLGLGSGHFRITARDITTSPFDDLITGDAIALQSANALLDPQNDSDLGATATGPAVTGTSFVATYTVQALATIPQNADYFIQTADGIATDDSFADLALTAASYTVHVVPEPSILSLAGLGLAAFLSRRQRRA